MYSTLHYTSATQAQVENEPHTFNPFNHVVYKYHIGYIAWQGQADIRTPMQSMQKSKEQKIRYDDSTRRCTAFTVSI